MGGSGRCPRAGLCRRRRQEGKSHFLQFCEETELNGLLHVPQTANKVLRCIYVASFFVGSVAVLFLFADILRKYLARPKGINQDFVSNEPMPFPELKLCRYLVGLSASQLGLHNVSQTLARALHWRLEVNYSPGLLPPEEVESMLEETRDEYVALKRKLNFTRFYQIIRHFLPRYDVIGHPMKAIIYQKEQNSYSENLVPENWLITYVEDLYLYNSICHCIKMPSDSVLALVIPFPPQSEYVTEYTKNFQLLPIVRSFLLMDENHDPIARVQPGYKYWGSYKLKSSYLMDDVEDHPCNDEPGYQQQSCIQACFGTAVAASPDCRHCQSVFMHANMSVGAAEGPGSDICDPWQWVACNASLNQGAQGSAVVECMGECVLACRDMSFEYTVTSVKGDDVLSKQVGWNRDFLEISENRSIFILSASKRPNKHVRIRQYQIHDLASVFGDVGGYMGLFLGSSVLTIVHIVVFWSRKWLVDPASEAVRKSAQTKRRKRRARRDAEDSGTRVRFLPNSAASPPSSSIPPPASPPPGPYPSPALGFHDGPYQSPGPYPLPGTYPSPVPPPSLAPNGDLSRSSSTLDSVLTPRQAFFHELLESTRPPFDDETDPTPTHV